ncbi:MAG: VWA domain-containing protein [Deltaproteobacteria bacterium]|nr:VWA domain-containing protein [Deltaproteobacteria bacterium]
MAYHNRRQRRDHPSPSSKRGLATGWLLAIGLGLIAGAGALPSCSAGNTGSSSSGSGGSGGMGFDAGNPDSSIDPDSACAVGTDEAHEVPVNMYIMFDKSFSMSGAKWSQTTAALQYFFADHATAGLHVALSFFPHPACAESDCNVQSCSHPQVPLGQLTGVYAPDDAQEDALINAFVGITPSGETPLSAALEGGLLWGENHLQSHPWDKAVVILVTDGEPTGCNEDHNYIVAKAHEAQVNSNVLTFAIGLDGSSESLMNSIASAGGTGQAIFVGTENAEQDLIDALNSIRESAIACEYQLPDTVEGQNVDPEKVNVVYIPEGAGTPITIGQVPSLGHCTEATGGWYYDDPLDPKQILFCPSTCDAIRADQDAEVQLIIGCETIPA